MVTTISYVCKTCDGEVIFSETVHEHANHEIYKVTMTSELIDSHEVEKQC